MSERACARGCECGARAERTLKPGDAVRWWPDGHDDDDRALVDRYIDGTVTALRPLCIRVTGSRGFTERIPDGFLVVTVGAVLDTSISPGTIQRLNPAPRAYVPGEKMTDRHPDSVIAQVVEETIAKQVEHLATPIKVRSPGEPAFRLFEQDGALFVDTQAGPIKITADPTLRPNEIAFVQPVAGEAFRGVDRSATPEKLSGAVLQKSAPAQPGKQWVAPVICEHPGYNAVFQIDPDPPPTTRPDGFDQRQVDACKAALLAPAPPRYPRTR